MLRKMILTAGLTAAFTTSTFAQFPKLNGPSLPTPKWNPPSLPAPNINLPKPVVPTPKIPTSIPSVPKPNVPVISERIPSVPKINLPDVPHIPTPQIPPSVTKIPTIPTPQIPKPRVPNISLPSAKDLGIRLPDKNRETPTVFTDPVGPSGRPSGKPGGKGETLGQSVPGVLIKRQEPGTPTTGQTKVVQPPEKPGGKPGVNVNVVFLPSGLLSGLSGGQQQPGGWSGRPERPGRIGRLTDSEQVVVRGGAEALYPPPASIGPNSPPPVATEPVVTTPVASNTPGTPQVVVVNQAWVENGPAGNGAVTPSESR